MEIMSFIQDLSVDKIPINKYESVFLEVEIDSYRYTPRLLA